MIFGALLTYFGTGTMLAWKKMPTVVAGSPDMPPLAILFGAIFYACAWLPALMLAKHD